MITVPSLHVLGNQNQILCLKGEKKLKNLRIESPTHNDPILGQSV